LRQFVSGILLISAAQLALLPHAQAVITCYECFYSTVPGAPEGSQTNCNDDFKSDGIRLVNCTSPQLCAKSKLVYKGGKYDGKEMISRGCGYRDDSAYCGHGASTVSNDTYKETVESWGCVCRGNNCNSAPRHIQTGLHGAQLFTAALLVLRTALCSTLLGY